MGYFPTQDLIITGQATQTASGNNIILATAGTGSTTCSGYKSMAIQIIPTGTVSSGVVTFEASNDGTTWVALPLYDEASLTTNPVSTVSPATGVNRYFVGPIYWKFVRARISTVIGGGGSLQAITSFTQAPYQPDIYTITQATAANLNATVTATNLSSNVAQVGGTNTVNGGVAGTLAVGGNVAHSAASTANPLQAGGRVAPTAIANIDSTLVAGDVAYLPITTGLQVITKSNGGSELDLTFPVLPSVTTTTAQSILGASGTALMKNYITGLTLQTDTLGAAGSVHIVDGHGATGVSVTIATPGVFTAGTHELRAGDCIIFTSLGTITGVSTNTLYYVTATSLAATTFTVATTPGGTALQITGSTAAFTYYRVFYTFRLPTTAITSPIQLNFRQPLKGLSNAATNVLIPTSLTSGTIYLTVNAFRGF